MSVDIIYDPIPEDELDQFISNAYHRDGGSSDSGNGQNGQDGGQSGSLQGGKLSDPYANYDHFTNKGAPQQGGSSPGSYSTSNRPM